MNTSLSRYFGGTGDTVYFGAVGLNAEVAFTSCGTNWARGEAERL